MEQDHALAKGDHLACAARYAGSCQSSQLGLGIEVLYWPGTDS